jgi:hypothetical protein
MLDIYPKSLQKILLIILCITIKWVFSYDNNGNCMFFRLKNFITESNDDTEVKDRARNEPRHLEPGTSALWGLCSLYLLSSHMKTWTIYIVGRCLLEARYTIPGQGIQFSKN